MIITREAVTLIHTDAETIGIPVEELYSTLSESEQAKAATFRLATDRTVFIIRRGLLRQILGETFTIQPSLIRFSTSPVGKPYLEYPDNSGIFFNLSHSGNQIVFAFSKYPDTGIDIERIRTVEGIDRLARNYFSAEEYGVIINLPGWAKNRAFVKIWSIKEALIKATGCPLEHGLVAFDVAGQYRLNHFEVPFRDNMNITCITPIFELICGYATALAIHIDDNKPLLLKRYTLQNNQYIEL